MALRAIEGGRAPEPATVHLPTGDLVIAYVRPDVGEPYLSFRTSDAEIAVPFSRLMALSAGIRAAFRIAFRNPL